MILVIDNFIDGEEKTKLISLVSCAKTKDLDHSSYNHKYSSPSKIVDENENKELYEFLNPHVSRIASEIEKRLYIELFPEPNFGITAYSVGEMLFPHYDGMQDDFFKTKTPNGNSSRDISSVLYLNDDYSGGELKFPFLNMSIRPPSGTLVVFPAGEFYTHSVEKVKSGLRCIIPQFWCKK